MEGCLQVSGSIVMLKGEVSLFCDIFDVKIVERCVSTEEGLFASHFASKILPKTDVSDGEFRPFSKRTYKRKGCFDSDP